MLLAGYLVELCVYCNLFQETYILKIHVLTCFCEIQPVHSRCYQQLPNWTVAGRERARRSPASLILGLCFPWEIFLFALLTVS